MRWSAKACLRRIKAASIADCPAVQPGTKTAGAILPGTRVHSPSHCSSNGSQRQREAENLPPCSKYREGGGGVSFGHRSLGANHGGGPRLRTGVGKRCTSLRDERISGYVTSF